MGSKCCDNCRKGDDKLTQVTDVEKTGDWKEFWLCDKCLEAYLQEPEAPQEMILETLFKAVIIPLIFPEITTKPHRPIVCECGWSDADFREFGRMGCAKCYDTFIDIVEKHVYPYHGADQHIGKRPKPPKEVLDLPSLKARFAWAVEHERYEDAAELKKQIDGFSAAS